MLLSLVSLIVVCGIILYTISQRMNSRINDHQGKVISLFMVIFIVGVVLILNSYNGLLQMPLEAFGLYHGSYADTSEPVNQSSRPSSSHPEYFYGVMFDAGSTGSRVHSFKFKEVEPGKPYQLIDALFKFNENGLSSFADDPEKGAASLQPLLDAAQKFVPSNQWKDTPIALKATAGLRLLPESKSTALLDGVKKLFDDCPFKVGKNAIAIMGGEDEGIFSWFTLNFLVGVLGNSEKMVGSMDLGGGSTQVTFVPKSKDSKNLPPFPIQKVDIFGKTTDIYTHSYLGLGLMAGRYQTLGGKELKSNEKESSSFTSPCLPANHSSTWDYNNNQYHIKGLQLKGESRFEACLKAATAVVRKANVHKPTETQSLNFTIFSYYYDRAVDAHLIDESLGGDIKVHNFKDAAQQECTAPKGKRFLCLDLTYISALLTEGFSFKPDSTLSIRKKVKRVEISWALGATFKLLNEHRT